MTIQQAIIGLLKSDTFMEDARKDAKLRVFKQRWEEGTIGATAAIRLLESYGYKMDIKKRN